jgi:hypothetical protein
VAPQKRRPPAVDTESKKDAKLDSEKGRKRADGTRGSSRRQPGKSSQRPTEPSRDVEEARATTLAASAEPSAPPPHPAGPAALGKQFAPGTNSHDGEVFRRGKDRIPRTRLTLMYEVIMRDGAERLYARLMNMIENGKDADLLRLVEIMGDRTEGRPTVRVEKQTRRVTNFIGPGGEVVAGPGLTSPPPPAAKQGPPTSSRSSAPESALDSAVAEELRGVEPIDFSTMPETVRRSRRGSFEP